MEQLIEKQECEERENFARAEAQYELEQQSVMNRQIGGTHYKEVPTEMQPWAIIDMYGLNYYEGCALKYLLRHKTNRIEDLEKLTHYIEKEISNLKFSENAKHLSNMQ